MADSTSDYDMFLDGLDDIPNMMELVKNAPASPQRFRVYPNNSHSMDQAFKGHCEVERHTFANQSRDMVRQASRVLDKLSSVTSPQRNKAKKSRPTHEVASIMTNHLKEDQGGMLFKNLDPYQHGHITQDDFIHILSTKNTGLSRAEMKEMAHELDKDRSGLLNYSNMYSTLDTLQKPPAIANSSSKGDSYSRAYEESKRGDSNSYSQNFEESKEPASSSNPDSAQSPAPVPAPVAQPYDGHQQYLRCQEKIEKEKQDIAGKKERNESRYGDAFDRATLMEKPSNSFAPHISVKATDNVSRYARGSGNIPSYKTPANMNDIVFNRFVAGRTGEKVEAVFGDDEVVGTLDFDKIGGFISDDKDVNSDDASSYTQAYESLKTTLTHGAEKENPASSSGKHPPHSHHHKSFVPLPTSKVTGGVDSEERMFLGNPNTGRNRNSRAFHNSFIFDHRVPARLRRPERHRSHSAPPGKRHFDTVDNKKINVPGINDPRLESVGSLLHYLSNATEKHDVMPSPVRVNQNKRDEKVGEPERKKFADFACAPPSPRKKTVMSDVKKSMNSLTSQLNCHSKIKILNHKMKKIDVSNSGYVNKSEFSTALKEMGVKVTPSQVTSLYEKHAKDTAGGPDINQSSLKLCSHQRGIDVQDFIQKMRTHTSSNMLASRRRLEDTSHTVVPTSSSSKTPLEREDTRVWKKVVEALSEENSGGKRIIADFFRDAQVNHQNEVHPDKLFDELNHVGSRVSDGEYRNMLSTVKRKSNGNVDVDDFAREYHKRSVECRDYDKWMALMPSLASSSSNSSSGSSSTQLESSIEAKGKQFKRILKTQKKHFVKEQGAESASHPNYRTADFKQRLNDPVVGATKSFEKSHVPACLTMSDAKEFRDERLKWSKLSNKFLKHKDSLLSAFGGEEGIHKPLTGNLMKDKLYEAGVFLGNDDLKILQSYATTSTTHEGGKDLTFGKMCSSMGLNVKKDNRRKMTLASSADIEHDSGIFGSSSKSLLATPNYQSSMLTACPSGLHGKFVDGNRKKRFDTETGQALSGAPPPMSSASDFWEMKHVPEIKKLPAKKLSYHQRLDLPEQSTNMHTSINGGSGRGFTSLRQMKEERKRSSSAPPRYSTLNRDASQEQAQARAHMWQRESSSGPAATAGGGRGRSTQVVGVEPSRFAAAPLAEFMNMRRQQQQQQHVNSAASASSESHNVRMTTQDLQTSYNSSASSEMDTR